MLQFTLPFYVYDVLTHTEMFMLCFQLFTLLFIKKHLYFWFDIVLYELQYWGKTLGIIRRHVLMMKVFWFNDPWKLLHWLFVSSFFCGEGYNILWWYVYIGFLSKYQEIDIFNWTQIHFYIWCHTGNFKAVISVWWYSGKASLKL